MMSIEERDRRRCQRAFCCADIVDRRGTEERVPEGLNEEQLRELARRTAIKSDKPIPVYGKRLDGKTGEPLTNL
jgi:hypothetical protein